MTKISFCHFCFFLHSHIIPICDVGFLFLNFFCDLLSHLFRFQLFIKLFEYRFPHIHILNTTMSIGTISFKTSHTILTWQFATLWLKTINEHNMFRIRLKDFGKLLPLFKVMVMITTTIDINTE